ncbi:hypothetical protein AB1Y20_004211 [Prymnesium parvum]|uniref:DUF2723 domain-containing protein n=1 Tax=Prymnesium parvum TaxID=97485 RepID=A0AB34J8R2_PRYPA
MAEASPPSAAHNLLASTALAALALSAYVRTAAPTVTGGDAGELIQLAAEGGVAHPPGYPLWTMLALLFSRLPYAEPAWRVALSSASAAAAAAGCLSFSLCLWSRCVCTALVGGAAFAFAPLVWTYAAQAEVFALNNLCHAALLLAAVRFDRARTPSRAYAGAFAVGAALSNQHTLAFAAAPYAAWALCIGGARLRSAGGVARLCVAAAAGMAPHAYLLAAGGEGAAWGSWGETRTARGLLTHVLRREYGTFRLANIPEATEGEFVERLHKYAQSVPCELPALGTPLLVLGVVCSLTTPALRQLGAVLLAAYVFYVLVFLYLSNLPVSSPFYLQVQQRFWPQAHFFCSIWYALGFQRVLTRLVPTRFIWWVRPLASVLVAASHAQSHFAKCDFSSNTLFRQYAAALLDTLPRSPRVLLLTRGDEVINSVRYAHRLLGIAPLLTVVDMNYAQYDWFTTRARRQREYSRVTFPGVHYGDRPGAYTMAQFLDANYGKFSIFVAGGFLPNDRSWEGGYRLLPLGMASRVARRDEPIDLDSWIAQSRAALPRLTFPPAVEEGSWEDILARNHYLSAYHSRPHFALQLAYEAAGTREELPLFEAAARLYDETHAVALNGSVALQDHYFRNMGVAYSQLIRLETSELGRARAKRLAARAFLRYLRFDTVGAADREQIEEGLLSLIPQPAAAAAATPTEAGTAARATGHKKKSARKKSKNTAASGDRNG